MALGSNLVFRAVTPYHTPPAGIHTVTVRSSTAPSSAAPMVVGQADVPSGGAVTAAAVAASDTAASLKEMGPIKLQMYTDDLSAPASGEAKVRVIHTVPGTAVVGAHLTAATAAASPTLSSTPVLNLGPISRYPPGPTS
jgi:hypothetical protein